MTHGFLRLVRSLTAVMVMSVLLVGGGVPTDGGSLQTFTEGFLQSMFAALLL